MHSPCCLATVRNAVLGLGSPLAQGPATRRLRRRLEDRVVAETAATLRSGRDPALERSPRNANGDSATRPRGLGECQGKGAAVACRPPFGRQARELAEQLDVV